MNAPHASLPAGPRLPHALRRATALALALLTTSAIAAAAPPAAGPAFTAGAITVERPWSRATPGRATVAAGYLVIRNAGDAPDRLVSASAEVAGRVGPHSMAAVNGVMEMRALAEGIVVPPHGTAVLAPGGDHLMLEELKRPLRKGDSFAATLVFEHAGSLPVTFAVGSVGAKAPDGGPGKPPMNMKMD